MQKITVSQLKEIAYQDQGTKDKFIADLNFMVMPVQQLTHLSSILEELIQQQIQPLKHQIQEMIGMRQNFLNNEQAIKKLRDDAKDKQKQNSKLLSKLARSATKKGLKIHLQIQKYLWDEQNFLSKGMQDIVNNHISKAFQKVRKAELLIEQYGNDKRPDIGIIGVDRYIIIDWKTGQNYFQDFRRRAIKYSHLYQCQTRHGEIWFVNVELDTCLPFQVSTLLNIRQEDRLQPPTMMTRNSSNISSNLVLDNEIDQNQRERRRFRRRQIRELNQFGKQIKSLGKQNRGQSWDAIFQVNRGHIEWHIQNNNDKVLREKLIRFRDYKLWIMQH